MKNDMIHRPRRLRRNDALRAMVRETRLTRDDFVLPLLKIGMKFPLRATREQVFAEIEVLEVTEDGKRFQATGDKST